jgi:hypothetical protein
MLSLFAIWKWHPKSSVIVVDNGSPIPLRKLIPEQIRMKYKEAMVILREETSYYEFGAYTAGLRFMRHEQESRWSMLNFANFYFMQAQLILKARIRSGQLKNGCLMAPFLVGSAPSGSQLTTGGGVIFDFLASKGLAGAGSGFQLGSIKGDVGALHTSFAANLEGAQLLDKGEVLASNFTNKKAAIQCEPMLGVLINRLMLKHGNHHNCAKFNVEAPWTKLHGSGGGFITTPDIGLAELLRFADVDMDGRMTKAELQSGITERAVTFERTWQSLCMLFPWANLDWAHNIIFDQQTFPTAASTQKMMCDVASKVAHDGASNLYAFDRFDGQCNAASAVFWAREGLNLLHKSEELWPSVDKDWPPISTEIGSLSLVANETLWGIREEPALPVADSRQHSLRELFSKELSRRLFGDSPSLDFNDLLHMMVETKSDDLVTAEKSTEKQDPLMTTLLPMCLASSAWMASSLTEYLDSDTVFSTGMAPLSEEQYATNFSRWQEFYARDNVFKNNVEASSDAGEAQGLTQKGLTQRVKVYDSVNERFLFLDLPIPPPKTEFTRLPLSALQSSSWLFSLWGVRCLQCTGHE